MGTLSLWLALVLAGSAAAATDTPPAEKKGGRPAAGAGTRPTGPLPARDAGLKPEDAERQQESPRLKDRVIRFMTTEGKPAVGRYVSHSWTSVRIEPVAAEAAAPPADIPWDKIRSDEAGKLLQQAIDPRAAEDHFQLGAYLVRRGRYTEAKREFALALRLDRSLQKRIETVWQKDNQRVRWEPAPPPEEGRPPLLPREGEGNPLDKREPDSEPKGHLDRAAWFQTVHTTGRRANRIDLVAVGDGYSQADALRLDTSRLSAAMRKISPFREYYDLFNFHIVFVDRSAYGRMRTEQGTVSVLGGRSGTEDSPPTADRQIVADLVSRSGVVPDLLCVVQAQGAGFSAQPAPGAIPFMVVGRNAEPEDLIRALAWALGNVGPEHAEARSGGHREPLTDEPPYANLTLSASRRDCKWRHWIGREGVGLYEGGLGQRQGIYRPAQHCLMRSRNDGAFCAVCREAISLAVLQRVRLIDEVEPAGNLVDTYTCRQNIFRAVPIPVSLKTFEFQWRINDRSADKKRLKKPYELVFDEGELQPGRYSIIVQVKHDSGYIRRDEQHLTEDRFEWKVTVNP